MIKSLILVLNTGSRIAAGAHAGSVIQEILPSHGRLGADRFRTAAITAHDPIVVGGVVDDSGIQIRGVAAHEPGLDKHEARVGSCRTAVNVVAGRTRGLPGQLNFTALDNGSQIAHACAENLNRGEIRICQVTLPTLRESQTGIVRHSQ